MSRRWALLAAAAVAVLAVAAACLILPLRQESADVLSRNAERVKRGMTLAEVEAIFGRPADERWVLESIPPQTTRRWQAGGTAVLVDFDNGETVSEEAEVVDYEPPSFVDRLRFWLR